jgi:serine/threonine protein kinase
MAIIVGGGPPANDAERRTIAHLRDNAPDSWMVLHNIEIPVRGDSYEVDLIVVTPRGLCVIDVKGTRGRIDVAGSRWYPERRDSFYSPVRKLRGHARALKGLLERQRHQLAQVYVDQIVVLTSPNARLVDPNDRADADALDVTDLDGLIPALADVSRVRQGMARDVSQHVAAILEALQGGVRRPTGPKRFGNWEVCERLGGGEDVTEYRATNATARTSETVLLRVYRADPFLPEQERASQRIAIANAYEVLAKMPPSPFVVGRRDFFPIEDESQFVLVLEDVHGQALTVHIADPRQALNADAKLRVMTDMLRGLAHAHAYSVLHRALTPSSVLVAGSSGRALLTGFDYARPETPRDHSVIHRLGEAIDPAYVAPECQTRIQAMSRASDVYAAGVIAFRLLTGELPFATSADQFQKGSVLPVEVMNAAGLSLDLATLLRRMCALAPSDRPSAADTLRELVRLSRPKEVRPATQAATGERPDYRNLPTGYQLTRKFTVRRKLGTGSFGTAYQAYDNLAAADRVVKVVHRDRESVIERLKLEYQTLLRLAPQRSLVKVEGADYLDGGEIPYLVFEYIEGRQVSELVEDRSLGPADAVKLGIDVAEGLAYLHENGIYHCDIKPSNLLRTDSGCKIFDFNVAVTADSSMSRIGGTSKYAPADFPHGGHVSGADLIDRDVYALGVTLYEVLTGEWPFSTPARALGEAAVDPRSRTGFSDLSNALVSTLLKAIAPLRSDRYGTAQEFLDALLAIGDQVRERTEAPPPAPVSIKVPAGGANPFVDHLQTLYSQSTRSNAGTRSGGSSPFDLYVQTALDERLIPDVLNAVYRLVVITGNAGDGKTAFLDRLLTTASANGPHQPARRDNGADLELSSGHWLRTNHDGSQDEGDKANDDVLLDFFAPFGGDHLSGTEGETRLIAINEGRLVDFFATYHEHFPALSSRVQQGLEGHASDNGIAIINLNRRSLFSDPMTSEPVFDRMLARMTDPSHWDACGTCELRNVCYARHNAQTFHHASAGPRITTRLRTLFQLTALRGVQHITVRDVQSALAFMLTSGRSCAQIHELYAGDHVEEILDGFYFNSWAVPNTHDRLLALLPQVDVATVADPGLDRRLDYVGPDAGRAVITVDQRGDYDLQMLGLMFSRLPRGIALGETSARLHGRYLAAARRRFYFECVDNERSRRMLPYRSASDFTELLARPATVSERLPSLLGAINRGEGLSEPDRLGGALALQRPVPGGTIRSYRLFPADSLTLTAAGAPQSPYLEGGAQELVLSHEGAGGHRAQLRIRLDLFEMLYRLRDGYLPGVTEEQGLQLGLTIFKNELSAAPYQEVLLTVTGQDLSRIRREPDGRLVMEAVAAGLGDV